jgi:hypothetical protein
MAPPMADHTIEGIARSLEGALAVILSQARIALHSSDGDKMRRELMAVLDVAERAGASMRLLVAFARYDAVARL